MIAADPRTVELPVCPVCGLVGKQPTGGAHSLVNKCQGPRLAPHKATKMEPHLFVEVETEPCG